MRGIPWIDRERLSLFGAALHDSPSTPESQTVVQETRAELPPELRGPTKRFLARAEELSQQPLAPLPGADERLAPLRPEEQQAFDLIAQRATEGSPIIASARQGLTQFLDPQVAFSPLANQLVDQQQGNIIDAFNTQVAPSLAARSRASGSFGNTGLQELEAVKRFDLARSLGESEAATRGGFLNLALQAQGLAPALANQDYIDLSNLQQVGAARRSFDQAGRDVTYQNYLEDVRNAELNRLGILGQALGQGAGSFRSTSSTTTGPGQYAPGGNPLIAGLGAGGQFLGGIGSLVSAF